MSILILRRIVQRYRESKLDDFQDFDCFDDGSFITEREYTHADN